MRSDCLCNMISLQLNVSINRERESCFVLPTYQTPKREVRRASKCVDGWISARHNFSLSCCSVGGYMSLMAAAKHRDAYRAAIAGCPVSVGSTTTRPTLNATWASPTSTRMPTSKCRNVGSPVRMSSHTYNTLYLSGTATC